MSGAKKKKSVLRKGLTKAFLAATLTFGFVMPAGETSQAREPAVTETQFATYEQDDYTSPTHGITHASRGLTAGEETLARSIFGAELDTVGMRFQFYPEKKDDTSALIQADETKNIEFYGRRYLPADFSQQGGKSGSDVHYNYGNFVALMTGALQHQQWTTWKHDSAAEGFDYALDKEKSFADYGLGQQMSIMTDYAHRFLHPSHTAYERNGDKEEGRRREEDTQLMRIVETRFPEAKKTREALWESYYRPPTPGEIELARAILGPGFVTEGLRLAMQPEDLRDVAATAHDARTARFWGANDHSADYSLENDVRLFGNYVHEILHVWQWQRNWTDTPNMKEGEYKYTLTAESKFSDYSIEQQAAMVEDYARYYLHAEQKTYWLQQTYAGRKEQREKLPILQQIVETQFPAAKDAREAFEAKKAQQRTPVAKLLDRVFG